MTPHDFIAKWRNTELMERSASQSHFNDLCALLGVLDPISADPKGEWFAFEKGASKTSGCERWADVLTGPTIFIWSRSADMFHSVVHYSEPLTTSASVWKRRLQLQRVRQGWARA